MTSPYAVLRDTLYGDPGRAVPRLTVALGVGVGLLTRSPVAGLATVLLGGQLWDRLSPRLVIEDPRLGALTLTCPRRAPEGGKQVWLTFDDGPGPDTDAVLDILERYRARATFFLIGEKIATYPELDRLKARLAAGGHRVGNHSWSHPSFLSLTSARTEEEISRGQAVVCEHFPDTALPIFRPPYGYRTETLFFHLQSAGLSAVGWSVNSLDFLSGPVRDVVGRVLEQTRPGSILLFHDGPEKRQRTVEALPHILGSLRERGFVFGVPSRESLG